MLQVILAIKSHVQLSGFVSCYVGGPAIQGGSQATLSTENSQSQAQPCHSLSCPEMPERAANPPLAVCSGEQRADSCCVLNVKGRRRSPSKVRSSPDIRTNFYHSKLRCPLADSRLRAIPHKTTYQVQVHNNRLSWPLLLAVSLLSATSLFKAELSVASDGSNPK